MVDTLKNAHIINEKIITALFPVMLDYREAFNTLFNQEQWQYPEFDLWCDELFFHFCYLEKIYYHGKPNWQDLIDEDCYKISRFYHRIVGEVAGYRYVYKVLTDDTFEDELSFRDPDFLLGCIKTMHENNINPILENKSTSLSHLQTIINFSKKNPKVLHKLEIRGF
ncbi:hypothetical protein [Lacinutrix chionoecetis]